MLGYVGVRADGDLDLAVALPARLPTSEADAHHDLVNLGDDPFDDLGRELGFVLLVTATGLPLAYRVGPLNISEPDTALELLGDYEKRVLLHLGDPATRPVSVLAADGGFTKPELRAKARELGLLENIHLASHSNKPESLANVAKKDAERFPFDDPNYKDWFVNGHREVVCRHDRRATKRLTTNAQGRVRARRRQV
jgi:hypothetical protein